MIAVSAMLMSGGVLADRTSHFLPVSCIHTSGVDSAVSHTDERLR